MIVDVGKRKIEVTVFAKSKTNFEYYIGGTQIGEIDTNISKYENVIIKENSIVEALKKMGDLTKGEIERQDTIENELSAQIKDVIDGLDIEEIETAAKETDEIDKFIEENGIERENIRGVKTISLDKEIEEEEKIPEKKKEQQEEKKEAKTTTTKDVNIKQEIELDERANDMHDLRKWLGGKIPKDIQKVGAIYSDQISEVRDREGKEYKENSTRYSLIAIGKDGKVEPLEKYIPNLKQRTESGNNPMEEKYQIDSKGNVEKDAVLSEYEIGNKIIQLDNKEMGRVEMNIGKEAHTSNETFGTQIRGKNTIYATSREQRGVISEYQENGVRATDESIREARTHEEKHKEVEGNTQEKMKNEDIDGKEETKSQHAKGIEEAYIQKKAREILDENPELKETYNQTNIANKLKKEMQEKNLTTDELEDKKSEIAGKIKEEAEQEKLPTHTHDFNH